MTYIKLLKKKKKKKNLLKIFIQYQKIIKKFIYLILNIFIYILNCFLSICTYKNDINNFFNFFYNFLKMTKKKKKFIIEINFLFVCL